MLCSWFPCVLWQMDTREVLTCEVEDGNTSDKYAVAIKKGGEIIEHVPRKISAVCNLFLELGGSLSCIITQRRLVTRHQSMT